MLLKALADDEFWSMEHGPAMVQKEGCAELVCRRFALLDPGCGPVPAEQIAMMVNLPAAMG